MAVVWREAHEQTTYEVRSQGRTLRLFANGVQHSEFHPDRLVTGSVWDLLWLPGFFAKPGSLKRVLILGLGGGSLVLSLIHISEPTRPY